MPCQGATWDQCASASSLANQKESLQPFAFLSQHHIKYQHLLKKKYVCPHPSCGRLFRLQKQLLRHAKHHTGMGRRRRRILASCWVGEQCREAKRKMPMA